MRECEERSDELTRARALGNTAHNGDSLRSSLSNATNAYFFVSSLHSSFAVGATSSEVAEMQAVLEMWQKQATDAHEELKKASANFKVLTKAHTALKAENAQQSDKLKVRMCEYPGDSLRSSLTQRSSQASALLSQLQQQSYDVDKLTEDLTNLTKTKAEVLGSIEALKSELSSVKASRAELQVSLRHVHCNVPNANSAVISNASLATVDVRHE